MNFNKNLKQFQQYLKDKKIDFYLVFSNDEFLKECSDLNQNARYLLSGFSGSAGDMLISQDSAYLFVDGRYHIQVDEQTDSAFITPIKLKMGEKRNEKIFSIIKTSKISAPKIALNSRKISVMNFENLQQDLKSLNATFELQNEDWICKNFATNEGKKVYKVWPVGIKQVGKSVAQKLKRLKKYENDFLLVFSNDEVCYLANIRADQNLYSSSLSAFALVGNNKVQIFTDTTSFKKNEFEFDKNIEFKNFVDFENELKNIKTKIFYEKSKTPLYYANLLNKAKICFQEIKQSPIAKMKSIKNKTELAYIQQCYQKSDEGVLKAIKYLNSKITNNEKITAKEFLDKLIEFQNEQGVIALSFAPILAINERSAIIHCTQFEENQILKNGDIILLDFGVYFEGGYATDMTRTFALGNNYKNEKFKTVYTTVLKAFLNTLNYSINQQSTYFDLDKKARNIIKKANLKDFNFNHGTGHGIGLNVHEMPPVLSPSKLSNKKLQANMVFSIEPGLYKENFGGVRLENSVCTIKTPSGIKIKTLTNLPFDEKLIILEMLNTKEKKWLQEYQNKALK